MLVIDDQTLERIVDAVIDARRKQWSREATINAARNECRALTLTATKEIAREIALEILDTPVRAGLPESIATLRTDEQESRTIRLCRSEFKSSGDVCDRELGHDGPHKGMFYEWEDQP